MRILGYILLIYGFIVIGLGRANSKTTALHTLSQHRDDLAAKETFTKSEVEGALLATTLSVAYHCRGGFIGLFLGVPTTMRYSLDDTGKDIAYSATTQTPLDAAHECFLTQLRVILDDLWPLPLEATEEFS